MPPPNENETYAGRSFRDQNKIYRLPGDQAELEARPVSSSPHRSTLNFCFHSDSRCSTSYCAAFSAHSTLATYQSSTPSSPYQPHQTVDDHKCSTSVQVRAFGSRVATSFPPVLTRSLLRARRAMQMAMEFPHANIVGVDIQESTPLYASLLPRAPRLPCTRTD